MSLEAMAWCDNVRAPSAPAKFVLWVLCDSAGPFEYSEHDRDFGFAMPPITEIARRTQFNAARIEKILAVLVDRGLIAPVGPSQDDGAMCYRLNISGGTR